MGAVAARSILVVGDSLSAEYGLARGSGWVALLEQRLAREHISASVVNASISGDTTAGGAGASAGAAARAQARHRVLELGGNDALRGLPIERTRANLAGDGEVAKAAGAKVLILGMQLPPNYGRAYGDRFAALFADVAQREGAALVPFMLKGVADVPNAESHVPGRSHPPAGERAPDHPRQRLAGAGASAQVASAAHCSTGPSARVCRSALSSRARRRGRAARPPDDSSAFSPPRGCCGCARALRPRAVRQRAASPAQSQARARGATRRCPRHDGRIGRTVAAGRPTRLDRRTGVAAAHRLIAAHRLVGTRRLATARLAARREAPPRNRTGRDRARRNGSCRHLARRRPRERRPAAAAPSCRARLRWGCGIRGPARRAGPATRCSAAAARRSAARSVAAAGPSARRPSRAGGRTIGTAGGGAAPMAGVRPRPPGREMPGRPGSRPRSGRAGCSLRTAALPRAAALEGWRRRPSLRRTRRGRRRAQRRRREHRRRPPIADQRPHLRIVAKARCGRTDRLAPPHHLGRDEGHRVRELAVREIAPIGLAVAVVDDVGDVVTLVTWVMFTSLHVARAGPIARHVDLVRREREPADRRAAADRQRDADARAADPGHQRRRVHRPRDVRARRPAPGVAVVDPAAVVERREAPRRIVDPGPAPRPHPGPMAGAVRRPIGGTAVGTQSAP